MAELLGKYYDKDTIKKFELVINKLLKKKYEWFDRIIVKELSYSKSQNYFGIHADLFADEDWVGNQWREFYYSKPMPSGTEDDPIVLGELIGGEFSKELQDDFKTVFMFITAEQRPKYMSYSWIDVIPIEMNNKKLQESIRRILREELNVPINVKRRFDRLKKLVDVVLSNSHPCDFLNEKHYLVGILYDLETFIITFEMEGMTNEQILSFVKDYFHKYIKQYYINSQEDC